ncbi:HpaA family protein [Helicobacter cynogastricus]|uniref:HpaA family protein n=1 Tax=Helicobacter cynogastricus TaxID=329937 RepID=UPI000CF0E4D5|nr:HpaA family protein [Helicobacter cynogastricus]
MCKKLKVWLSWVLLGGCGVLLAGPNVQTTQPSSTLSAQEKPKPPKSIVGDTLLDFNYPINIVQEPINNRFVGLLAPHMQVSDNLKPYVQKFQDALLNQIQEIFQKRGYQVLRFTSKDALTAEEKRKTWAVLNLSGWVGVLEDVKMNTSDPAKQDLDVMVDQSSGSVWFNFFEPETGRIIHNFGVDVGNDQATTHTYSYHGDQVPQVDPKQLIKDKDDAIRKILNDIYAKVMQKLVTELTDANINRYRNAIEKIKK